MSAERESNQVPFFQILQRFPISEELFYGTRVLQLWIYAIIMAITMAIMRMVGHRARNDTVSLDTILGRALLIETKGEGENRSFHPPWPV